MTAEENARMEADIDASEQSFHDAGYDIEICFLSLDVDLESFVVPRLKAKSWDVIVIGGGIRKPPELLQFFEGVVNAVHRHAPNAAIAFNTKPMDCLEATERWVRKA